MEAANPTPNEPEKAPDKPAKRRSRRKQAERPSHVRIVPNHTPGEKLGGMVFSKRDIEQPDWFFKPWFAKKEVSLISGKANVGKSSFLAFLLSQVKRSCLWPGLEESIKSKTLGRLVANGVDLDGIRWLVDRRYSLPSDTKEVVKIMQGWGAELLVVDPISNQMDRGWKRNDDDDVRAYLECFTQIAEETRTSVIGIRHPAKWGNNPLPGSSEWVNVVRSVVSLGEDPTQPGRFLITHLRDSHGQKAPPREYDLVGPDGKPKRFVLGGDIDESLGGLTNAEADPTDRIDIRKAGRYIRHFFKSDPKPLVSDLVKLCKANGVTDRARRKAMELLGVNDMPGGMGGKWIMTRERTDWPTWTEE